MAKLLLTQKIVNGLKCESGKSHEEYCDLQVPGLLVYCTSSPTYIPKYQVRGKNSSGTNQLVTLGSIRELTLANARALALRTKLSRAAMAKTESRNAALPPAEMTWNTFIADHYAPFSYAHLRSAKKYTQLDRIYVAPIFGDKPLSMITRKAAQDMHVEIVEKKKMSPATADHVIKYMRAALNKAIQYEFLERNPLKNFDLFLVDNQVNNILTDAQMQRLLSVLLTDKNRSVCQILMLLLSTGARMNEVLSATWKNVSLEGRSLKVDAIRSKSKRSRSIPLNDSAMWVIEQLTSRDKSDYLFPSPVFANEGKDLPYRGIFRTWRRIQKLAKINIRAHDLRHGFASMLISSNRTLFEVQTCLGHSDPKTTMRYAHLSSSALMAAANTASVIVKMAVPQQAQPPVAVAVTDIEVQVPANDISAAAQWVETQQVKVG